MYSTVNRTVVFVDGQNFRKNLQTFAFRTGQNQREYRLDEKHFDWQPFFADLVAKFDNTNVTHSLMRVYWYNADDVTSWRERPAIVQKALQECQRRQPGTNLTDDELRRLAREWWERQREFVRKAREDVSLTYSSVWNTWSSATQGYLSWRPSTSTISLSCRMALISIRASELAKKESTWASPLI